MLKSSLKSVPNEHAFDISSWQRRPSLKWFKAMKAAGHTLCWVQLWGLTPTGNRANPDAEYQLTTALAAGLEVGGYIVIYGDTTDDTHILVRVALDAAGAAKKHLRFVALDVESAPIRMERLLNAYSNIGKQLPGVVRTIYTSCWKWSVAFGTTPWPHAAETPLLEARYVLNSGHAPATPPDLEWLWLPFGGWTERALLQYAGTVPTLGVGVDRCVLDRKRMKLTTPPPPPPPPKPKPKPPAPPPPPPPPPPPKPPTPKTRRYKVKSSDGADGLSGIALRELGNASRWPEIAALNGLKAPYRIYAGRWILLPANGAPKPPAPKPRVRYVIVQSGDYASKWFASEAALLRLNPNFKTRAYRSNGRIMRRFTNRSWHDIYPPERLRIA